MKNRPPIYILFFLTTLLFMACSSHHEKVYRVWVLHSYQEDCSWMKELNRGIIDGFKKEKIQVDLSFNYLHSNYDAQRCQDSVKAMLDRIERPDIILSVNDQATQALLAVQHPHTNEYYGSQIIFCGIDYPDAIKNRIGNSNYQGFTTRIDLEQARTLAALYNMNKMNLFIKPNNICSTAVAEITKQAKTTNSSLVMKLDTIKNIPFHDIYYKMTNEHFQHFFVLAEWDSYLCEFIKTSSTPYINLSNEGFGIGQLGGYFTSSYQQTFDGARLAAQNMLYKRRASKFMQESEKHLFIDWNALQKFNFREKKLPPNVQFINMPFHIRYRTELMITLILGIILLTLLAAFVIYKIKIIKQKKKESEESLKQQRDNLQVITDSISEGIISIRANGTIASMNTEARQLLQLDPTHDYTSQKLEELIEIVDASTSQNLKSLLQATLEEKQTVQLSPFAMIQCKKTDNYFLAEGEFTPLDKDQTSNGAVFSFTDRTDEFTTQEYLSLTAASGQLFFWWYDFNNGNLNVDPSFFTLFDLPDDGIHTLPLSTFLHSMNPEDLAKWREIYAHQRFDRDIKTIQETRINMNGKGEQWWEVRMSYHQNNKIEAQPTLYGLCVNIQNYKEKQEILQETRDNVSRSEQLKSAFLSNMSHEIRTPLNGIIGFARLIASNESFDADEHKLFVETIQSNCNLMLALINDILDLARIDSGNMTYDDASCNLNELIMQILTTQQVILQKPLQLIHQLPDEPEFLHIDPIRLNQVITNLINNAVKFTEKGSITAGYTSDAEQVCIFVSDTGIGIPKEEQKQIFERFYKKNNDVQGAGIGLNLCKNIIEHYNGHIEVISEVGKGTTFKVTLSKRKVNDSKS